MNEVNFKVDYVVRLPLEGHNPKVTISGNPNNKESYRVFFYDNSDKSLVFSGNCIVNQTIIGTRQWHTDWLIHIVDNTGKIVHINEYNPTFRKVYIKIDAYALGDNIAWMPYIEEYRKKYNCDMICSTFHNHLFYTEYPEILFVPPDTMVENLYAQFYIGAATTPNIKYSPVTSISYPLQMVASATLGLKHKEIRPKVGYRDLPRPDYGGEYVCISEFGSAPEKSWQCEGGWQAVVDYLVIKGYKVVVISKEPTNLVNVINKTGDIPLAYRIPDIEGAAFYMGVSSGLAWLSWALGTHVVMISDVTPSWHEFQSGITRIIHEEKDKVDYSETPPSTIEEVISKIDSIIV